MPPIKPLIPLMEFPPSSSTHHPGFDSDIDSAETEDEEYANWGTSSKRFVSMYDDDEGEEEYTTLWKELMHDGGFGKWLFQTSIGWQFFVGTLALWLVVCDIGLVIVNRVFLWSEYLHSQYTSHTQLLTMIVGVYKFPYPLTLIFLELLVTHIFLLISATITRILRSWFTSPGLAGAVAPSAPFQGHGSKRQEGNIGFCVKLARWTSLSAGGIAGGGILEFDRVAARHAFPLALISVAKFIVTNLCFTHSRLQVYFISRVGIVPLTLLFTAIFGGQRHTFSTIFSSIIASLSTAIASYRYNLIITWESLVLGFLSSIFVALYPIQIQRTYKKLLDSMVSNAQLLGSNKPIKLSGNDCSSSPEETRAYWRLLHYTSILSILIYLPILFFSGEVSHIWRNPYVLDIYFHRHLVFLGGLGSWAVFFSTVALTRATSPLTANFMLIPKVTSLVLLTTKFDLPPGPRIGIALSWLCTLWFVNARRKQLRRFGSLGCGCL